MKGQVDSTNHKARSWEEVAEKGRLSIIRTLPIWPDMQVLDVVMDWPVSPWVHCLPSGIGHAGHAGHAGKPRELVLTDSRQTTLFCEKTARDKRCTEDTTLTDRGSHLVYADRDSVNIVVYVTCQHAHLQRDVIFLAHNKLCCRK